MSEPSIKLYQGDDSDFADLREIDVTLDAGFSLSGCSAKFKLQGHEQTFDDISSGEFTLSFPHATTRRFAPGRCFGTLVLFDSESRRKTIANRIPFLITRNIEQVSEDADDLTMTITVESDDVTISVGVDGFSTGDFVQANPDDANFRVKDIKSLQLYNVSTGLYHNVWLENDGNGNPALKWAETGES